MSESGPLYKLVSAAESLSDVQVAVLTRVAERMHKAFESETYPEQGLGSWRFFESFGQFLSTFHMFSDVKLTKKMFETFIADSFRHDGRQANQVSNSVNAGADVIVDGVGISCKTEGAESMSSGDITISKLMEARWIRECKSSVDVSSRLTVRIREHVSQYDRILLLRSFGTPPQFRYDLYEIPKRLIESIASVEATAFSEPNENHSSGANIPLLSGSSFRVVLDGSVEKVTIRRLPTSECVLHGRWRISV